MNEAILNEKAWAVFCVETREFLCGTAVNRRFGKFDDARIFRKKSAASNSKNMLTDSRDFPGRRPVVVPITVTVDLRYLFKAVLKGGE